MPPIRQTLRYVAGIALRPRHTTDRFLADPDRLRHAVIAWLSMGVAYGLVAFIGGRNGFGPIVEPYLPIPLESYYLWMGLFSPLLFLLNFLILAGLAHILGRWTGGAGSFDDTFAVASMTFFLPVLATMWIWEAPMFVLFPELRREELGGLGYLPEWLDLARQIAGLVWILGAFTLALSRVQRVSLTKSLCIGLPAFVAAWLVTLTYLR